MNPPTDGQHPQEPPGGLYPQGQHAGTAVPLPVRPAAVTTVHSVPVTTVFMCSVPQRPAVQCSALSCSVCSVEPLSVGSQTAQVLHSAAPCSAMRRPVLCCRPVGVQARVVSPAALSARPCGRRACAVSCACSATCASLTTPCFAPASRPSPFPALPLPALQPGLPNLLLHRKRAGAAQAGALPRWVQQA